MIQRISILTLTLFFLFSGKNFLNAEEPSTDQNFEDLGNILRVSLSEILIQGDNAQFKQRVGIPDNFSGGIEEFSFEQQKKDVTTHIQGHGLFDAHDYFLKLGVEKNKVGKFNFGYKEFRTWYDGSGGFFPANGRYFTLYDEELALDRGSAWFDAELALPDLPVLGFKYSYEFREGEKDSLLWGDSRLIQPATADIAGGTLRKIVPSLRRINERRDIFEGSLKHAWDQTDIEAVVRYEKVANNNALYVTRNPSEVIQRTISTHESEGADIYSFHTSTETWFSEKLLFTTGYSTTSETTDIGGSFIYGRGFDAPFVSNFPGKQSQDSGFLDLNGGSKVRENTLALNMMAIPWEDWTLTAGTRAERKDLDGVSSYTQTTSAAAGGFTTQQNMQGMNNTALLDVSESLEARYKGIPDWAFYARGNWKEGDGSMHEDLRNLDTQAMTIHRDADLDRLDQKYTAGANWYPLKNLNFGTQYYRKMDRESYLFANDFNNTPGDQYPSFIKGLDVTTDDANFRVTWRPLSNLTTVTRYDYQETFYKMIGGLLGWQESGRTTRHVFSESISWTPVQRLYLQTNVNYALDGTESPATALTGQILESKNNYLSLGLTTGYALNDKTNLQAQYDYYRANNFYDNSLAGMPYGSGDEDHKVTLSLIRRIAKNILFNVKYGYFTHGDELYGGFNDYEAHLIYASLQIAF